MAAKKSRTKENGGRKVIDQTFKDAAEFKETEEGEFKS